MDGLLCLMDGTLYQYRSRTLTLVLLNNLTNLEWWKGEGYSLLKISQALKQPHLQ